MTALHHDDLDNAIALLTNDITSHVIEWSREAKTLQDSITFKMRVDALRVLVDLKRTPPELDGAPLADTVRKLGRMLGQIDTRQEHHAGEIMRLSARVDTVENAATGGILRRIDGELQNHCHRLANLEQVTKLLTAEKQQ